MAERFFSIFQIGSLLRAAPGAVVEWMDKGWLNCTPAPEGTARVAESDLVRFLEGRGFDFGDELAGTFTAEQRDEVYRRARARRAAANIASSPVASSEPDEPGQPDDRTEAPAPEIEAEELSLPEPPQSVPAEAAPSGDLRAGQICDAILADAVKHGAGAIHLTPHRDGLRLQLRINGSLHDKPNFDRRLSGGLKREIIACLLNRANPDIAPEDLAVPCSVEFTRSIEGSRLALRLSALPTVDGPRLVIRMPHRPAAGLDLEDAARGRLEELLQGDGLIVVASKRRTGRDQTLRALLADADTDRRSAIAIEANSQPDLDDVARIQINPAVGLTYATAMAAMEYQGADVIVLAELRDPATALAAFDAAHDGALIIAGINAVSALAATDELLAMGLEPWPLGNTLKAIVEQASVRTLCEHCRGSEDRCDRCGQTGWSGRTVLSGVVFIEGQLARLIRTGGLAGQFERAISQACPDSLAHAAQVAVDTGVTTPAEVARILRRN